MSNKENTEYDKERVKQIFELRKESDMQFDKQLRYIAAGAIALSVTLIASIKEITLNWVLLVAWILLILTLLINLISYRVAVKAMDFDIKNHPANSSDNKYNKWTNGLNVSSIVTLVAGLILLVLFFFLNK